MDQAKPESQGILRYQQERVEDAYGDRYFRVCPHGHCQKTIEMGSEPLHSSTDFECGALRKTPVFQVAFFTKLQKLWP